MQITQLFLYPVKSLGCVPVSEAIVEARGFRYDRRFMLVQPESDEAGRPHGRMMTQREFAQMALIEVAFGEGETLRIWHRRVPNDVLTVPLTPPARGETLSVRVWDSPFFSALPVGDEADRWFSRVLQTACRLVLMPDSTERAITSSYRRPRVAVSQPVVSFADGFPYLLASEESLAELNRRLTEPVPMSRFRPNVVVDGTAGPHDEDTWAHFRMGRLDFFGVKPCVRCVMTTIDSETGQQGKEPLKALATYRRVDHKILFAQNVMAAPGASGTLRVGDAIEVLERMETWL